MTDSRESELEPDETAVLLHDLRTPLAAMRTAAEIVAGEPLSRRQADALHTLELAIDSLLAMTRGALEGAPDASRATLARRHSRPSMPLAASLRPLPARAGSRCPATSMPNLPPTGFPIRSP